MLGVDKYHYMTVSALPGLMDGTKGRDFLTPLLQFIADWNTWPDVRNKMLDSEPEGEMRCIVRIAAVVHGLCLRDGVDVPGWVSELRFTTPELLESTISPESNYGQMVIEQAHPVCEYHNLYFQPDLLEKGSPKQKFTPVLEDGAVWVPIENDWENIMKDIEYME